MTAPSTVVTFSAEGRRWAVDVDAVAGVREAGDVRPLPDPLPEVLGVLDDGGETLTVLGPFGPPGEHVLLLRGAAGRYALAVDEVERVVRVRADEVGPAPAGQARSVVAGTVGDALLIDATLLEKGLRA